MCVCVVVCVLCFRFEVCCVVCVLRLLLRRALVPWCLLMGAAHRAVNGLGTEGGVALAEALKINTTLTSIDLESAPRRLCVFVIVCDRA